MILWKVYLWAMVIITLLATLTDGHIKIVDGVDLLITALGLIGLFCYAYKRELLPKSVWQIFTILAIIYHYFYSFLLDKQYGGTPATTLGGELLTAVILTPLFIGLIIFSFSQHRN